MTRVLYKTGSKNDEAAIVNFLWSLRDDLLFSERNRVTEIVQLIFAKGGTIVGYHNDVLVAMVGYFLGEPSRKYANKEVGFIYIAGIAQPHRLSRAMWHGLDFTFRHLQELDVNEFRCHAREGDPYTNRLYAHFAKRLGEDVNLRGYPTILYGNTIENVLAYLNKRRGRSVQTHAIALPQPTQFDTPLMPVTTVRPNPQMTGALWYCGPCDGWWLHNATSLPENWHLERLTALDNLAQQQSKAPAWPIREPALLFCPECGKRMRTQSLPTQERVASCV